MNKHREEGSTGEKNHMSEYAVLIPAYKPDAALVDLVDRLRAQALAVYVVDDGSGEAYGPVFDACVQRGAVLIRHPQNRGKGAALKTGIGALRDADFAGVVTADADGQHTPEDIGRVMQAMHDAPDALVLGVRAFAGEVPMRSRVGNGVTRVVFRLATGIGVSDTQTGLRGLPARLFERLAALSGERYEYEMNMLLNLGQWNVRVVEVPIRTIYIEGNKSSHFDPLRDSWRIYGQILRFTAASLVSFGVDYSLYFLFVALGGLGVSASYALARLASALVNYYLNRSIVFKSAAKGSLMRYFILAAAVLLVGSGATYLLGQAGIGAGFSKVLVDIPLFFINYYVQRGFVFAHRSVKGRQNAG